MTLLYKGKRISRAQNCVTGINGYTDLYMANIKVKVKERKSQLKKNSCKSA